MNAGPESSAVGCVELFLARQAILDTLQRTHAYELLFRSGRNRNAYDGTAPGESTRLVIRNTFLVLGAKTVLGGKLGFINLPQELLLDGTWKLLPPSMAVVEILEDTEPTDEVVAACVEMRKAGMRIALDDFTPDSPLERLLPYADYVKVEFPAWTAVRSTLTPALKYGRAQLIAEKVETRAAFDQARSMGFPLFQGFFFTRPVMIVGRDIAPRSLTVVRVLNELRRGVVNLNAIADLVRADLALTHHLLRYVNSAAFSWRNPITSVHQALIELGESQLQRWVAIALVSNMRPGQAAELCGTSLSRARFCELICEHSGHGAKSQEAFLVGLFSLLDTILGQPMSDIVADLNLGEETSAALLGQDGRSLTGRLLRIALACERASWEQVETACREDRLEPDLVSRLYREAFHWADEMTVSTAATAA